MTKGYVCNETALYFHPSLLAYLLFEKKTALRNIYGRTKKENWQALIGKPVADLEVCPLEKSALGDFTAHSLLKMARLCQQLIYK